MKNHIFQKEFFNIEKKSTPAILIIIAGLFFFISMIIYPLISTKKTTASSNKIKTIINKSLQVTNQAIFLDDTIELCRFVPVVGGDVQSCRTNYTPKLINDSIYYIPNYDYKTIHLKSFLMTDIPVTHNLYNYVMSNMRPNSKDMYDQHTPIQWNEFIKTLCEITGRTFRLPTDAEWEYAAKGGNKQHGYIYSGSNDINEVANYGETNPSIPFVFARKKMPNELGLYDMSGSVWELTSDINEYVYCYYPDNSKYHPLIARGGCLFSKAEQCAISAPFYSCNDQTMVGVRLVLEY